MEAFRKYVLAGFTTPPTREGRILAAAGKVELRRLSCRREKNSGEKERLLESEAVEEHELAQ